MPEVLIAFDLDGTLVDGSEGIHAAAEAGWHEITGSAASMPALHIGPPLRTMMLQALKRPDEALAERWAGAFRHHYDGGLWTRCRAYPGIKDALRTLFQAGLRLAVVTNKPHLASTRILHHLDLAEYLSAWVSLDSPTGPFPTKQVALAQVMTDLNIRPEDTLYIGDDAQDRKAAVASGAVFLPVSWGFGDATATHTAADLPPADNAATLISSSLSFARSRTTPC